uniref:G protein-coupled receptor n=1 Tax=Panagrolaimus davidi TaxID=227884 RepID=A0A914P757_9BILA
MMILMLYFAMSLVDCIAGMSAERYYAIRNKEVLGHSKKPQIIFGCLFFSNFAFLGIALGAALINNGKEAAIMSYNESLEYMTAHVQGSEKVLEFSSILLMRADKQNSLIIGAIGFLFFAFARYLTASVFLVLNATTTSPLKSSTIISKKLQKNNKMLLRCTYIQFAGFILLAGLPTVLIAFSLFALSEPTKLTTFCILAMNSFGLYDTFVTIICIKPYRMAFINFFKKLPTKETTYNVRTLRITSVPSIL